MAGVQSRNEIEFDVKLKLTEALYFTCGAYISRFPYLLAILLMLETGEMFKTSLSVDQSRLTMAYAHLGGYFLAATAMSFNLFQAKRTFALFTAVQFGVLSVGCYLETERKEGLLVRQVSRNIAVLGCYLMIAGGLSDFERGTQRHRRLLQIGLQLLGVYSFINAVILWNSPNELKAYITHLPGGQVTAYVFLALYLISGMCIYGGYNAFYFSKVVAWLLVVATLFVDLDPKFWWNAAHIPYWASMTIASKNSCIIATLLLIRGKI